MLITNTSTVTKILDTYLDMIRKAEFNMLQAYYSSIAAAKTKSNKWVEFVSKGKKLELLEKYQVQMFDGGKYVSLRGIDDWNRGEGILRHRYTKNGQNYVLVYDILLCKIVGSKDFEIVWYNMQDKNFFKGEAK